MKENAWITSGNFMVNPLIAVAFILLWAAPNLWAAPPQVAAVGGTTYVIKKDGGLWAWGRLPFREPHFRHGEGGDESLDIQVKTSAVPIQVTGDSDWAYISTTGTSPHMAIKTDGSLWAWSWMPSGWGPSTFPKEQWKNHGLHSVVRYCVTQVSTDPGWWTTSTGFNPPEKAPLSKPTDKDFGWASAASGVEFAVLLKSDGTLWAWGSFNENFKGPGSGVHYSHPTQVGNDHDWKAVTAVDHHVVALKKDGSLWGWGINTHLLGLGRASFEKWVPEPVQVGEEKDWETVTAGGNFFLARKADGSLWAWGANPQGVRGISPDDPITTARYLPNRIDSDSDWAAIGAGYSHALAIKKDGSLWAWGNNEHGQLGLGEADQVPHPAPARVGTGTDWVAVDGGGAHTVALKTDGSVWSWGSNFAGQLGDGTKEDRYLPVRVFSVK